MTPVMLPTVAVSTEMVAAFGAGAGADVVCELLQPVNTATAITAAQQSTQKLLPLMNTDNTDLH
jgi:hypothetical protein